MIDILILAVIAVGGVIGFTRGLMVQLGSIVALVAGVVVARLLGPAVAGLWAGDSTALDSAAAYGVAFLVGYVAAWLMARVLRKTVHTIHLGIIDRICGAVFKVLQWGLVLSLALNIYMLAAGGDCSLNESEKPWRRAAVDFAPAVLGYLADLNNHRDASGVIIPKCENSDE